MSHASQQHWHGTYIYSAIYNQLTTYIRCNHSICSRKQHISKVLPFWSVHKYVVDNLTFVIGLCLAQAQADTLPPWLILYSMRLTHRLRSDARTLSGTGRRAGT